MTSLIVFCAIAILSLVVVSLANQQEERQRSRRNRLNRLKMRVDELENLLLNVGQLLESQDILIQINEEISDMYRAMIDLDPNLPYLETGLHVAEQRGHQLMQSNPGQPRRLLESDAKIALAQKHLAEAARVIRHRHSHAKISLEELQLFMKELSFQHLMVDVISMVGQGHKATNKGNLLSAQAFYKKARQMLMLSTHSDPRRPRFIKELAGILDGQTKSISSDLMPETYLNPDQQRESNDQLLDDILDKR